MQIIASSCPRYQLPQGFKHARPRVLFSFLRFSRQAESSGAAGGAPTPRRHAFVEERYSRPAAVAFAGTDRGVVRACGRAGGPLQRYRVP